MSPDAIAKLTDCVQLNLIQNDYNDNDKSEVSREAYDAARDRASDLQDAGDTVCKVKFEAVGMAVEPGGDD